LSRIFLKCLCALQDLSLSDSAREQPAPLIHRIS
jgi:hypothetical protein